MTPREIVSAVGTNAKNYALIAGLLILCWIFSVKTLTLTQTIGGNAEGHGSLLLIFFEITVIFASGFLAYEAAQPTIIPSFVIAIFIGMIEHNTLSFLVQNTSTLTVLTTLGAIFILFGGGLDTPFTRFRELLGPILSIAFIGTLITAFFFSATLGIVSSAMGTVIPLGAAILVGAALASTDPAAIIPSLKSLNFINPRVKYIAVSESALNDVVGAVLTGVFLALIISGFEPHSLTEMYAKLLSADTGFGVARQLFIGIAIGACGFFVLQLWNLWKIRTQGDGEADAALFLAVPLICYLASTILGGNGFLAVFVSSLLFHLEGHCSHVEQYFNHTIEGFMKPLIFILLGATVDFQQLFSVAPLGIAMGCIFMFVLRPIAVFATLMPFMKGGHRLTLRELLFLSFVRETGVIPAVLLVGLNVSGIPGTDTVVAIGLWVILLTLIVEPPLTPMVARLLGIATDVTSFPVSKHKGPLAVLCSRGLSFMDRMDTVVAWAQKHAVDHVILLHCAEAKFSEELSVKTERQANELFTNINERLVREGGKKIAFTFVSRTGLLQDNIEQLLAENDKVSIVFVGRKMLDYRLQDVKRLNVPFVFVE